MHKKWEQVGVIIMKHGIISVDALNQELDQLYAAFTAYPRKDWGLQFGYENLNTGSVLLKVCVEREMTVDEVEWELRVREEARERVRKKLFDEFVSAIHEDKDFEERARQALEDQVCERVRAFRRGESQ